MPFKMSFTDDATGATYPDSYWHPNDFTVNYGGRVIQARYVCYLSIEAQVAGKQALPFTKSFTVTANDFVSLLKSMAAAPPSVTPLPIQIAQLLDQIALQQDDFFKDAELVAVDLGVLSQELPE